MAGPLLTDASSTGPVPIAPKPAPRAPAFFTTLKEAHQALPADGSAAIRFTAGKGYYVGAPLPAKHPAAGATTATQQSPLQQAQTTVSSFVDPIIQEIQKTEQARSQAGQQAITGYTQAEQQLLQNESPLAAAAYGSAQQGQNAIDQALASRLQGQGDQNASALGAKLASLSVDPGTAARINGQAATDSTGAANAAYAKGSATLSALNQEGAANQGYLASLPGVAALSGLQSSKQLQGQINTDTQTALGNVTDQVPGMVQTQLGQINSADASAAALGEKAREADNANLTNQQKIKIAALIADGKIDEALKVATMNNNTKVAVAGANNDTKLKIAASRDQITQAQDSTKNRLAFAKTYGFDPTTGRVIAGYTINSAGNVVKISAAPKQSRLTAKQRQDYIGTATTIASNSFSGFTDAKNTKHPAISYTEALDEMDKEGVPKPIALAALSRYYPVNTGTVGTSFPPLTSTTGK